MIRACCSYLSPSRRSSPSPRWNVSGTRRVWSWEPVLPAAGCGRWFGPDTNRAAHSAAPTAPPSGLERRARQLAYRVEPSDTLTVMALGDIFEVKQTWSEHRIKCVKRTEVSLTGADRHLCAASCREVREDDCQLTTTRELQTERETTHPIRLLTSKKQNTQHNTKGRLCV